jgi:dTMP kinase
MKKNTFGGKFIVFEGLDGSGQSTQAALLAEYIRKQGLEVLLTKEPTQWTAAGKKIKEVLEEKTEIAPLKLQQLFVRDRAEHLRREIIPALKKGKVVICDRYFFSTIAYGGLAVPQKKLVVMNRNFLCPDMTLFLRVSPEECLRRIEKRGEGVRFFEKLEKLKKVALNYERLLKMFSLAKAVDGARTIKQIHRRIIVVLKGVSL